MTEMKTSEHYQKKGEEAATSRVLDATVGLICFLTLTQLLLNMY